MTQPYHHGALREALIGAAEAVLERDGIAALTLRAAAREAGVSHAAPAHHFGNLSGLLSALAAQGYGRFRTRILAEIAAAASGPESRAIALGRGYVGFAQASPGLFQLMFRSEQLDWSDPGLAAAGAAAIGLMMPANAVASAPPSLADLVAAMTHWSMAHGLASLLIDGRFAAVAEEMAPGVDVEMLIGKVLSGAQ